MRFGRKSSSVSKYFANDMAIVFGKYLNTKNCKKWLNKIDNLEASLTIAFVIFRLNTN